MEGWACNGRRISFFSGHRRQSEFRTADDYYEFNLRDFRQNNTLQFNRFKSQLRIQFHFRKFKRRFTTTAAGGVTLS